MSKHNITSWVQKHKSKLLIMGGFVVASVGAILIINSMNVGKEPIFPDTTKAHEKPLGILYPSARIAVSECNPHLKTVNVREHLRNLPKGQFPSEKKIAEAAKSGLELIGQTIVSEHSRCYAA